jgi:hypothetical protein
MVMLNQGNVIPGGGKETKKLAGGYELSASCGVPTAKEQPLDQFGVKGSPDNVNVRPISDGQGPRPNPSKTILPESDEALREYAAIKAAHLSQGVFTHEQNVSVPSEGFNDPANLKV